jgi:PAS domain S-box-containing protein
MRQSPASAKRAEGMTSPQISRFGSFRFGLKAHLIGLVLAVLVPALALGAASAWYLAEGYRTAFRNRLADTVRALASTVENEFEILEATAATLASSSALPRRDMADFRPQALAAAARLEARVVVNEASPGFRQLINTAIAEGVPLPPPGPVPANGSGAGEVITRALKTGRPAISNLFEGRARAELLAAVAAPTTDGTAVVVVGVTPDRFNRLVASQPPAGGGIVALADGENRIVARSRDHGRYVGAAAPGTNVATSTAISGLFEGRTSDGELALYAFHRLRNAPGWSIVIAEPLAAYRWRWTSTFFGLFGGAVLALGLGVVLAMALARRVGQPVTALLARAEEAASGRPAIRRAPLPSASVAEFEILREAMERADAALFEGEAEFRAAFQQAAVPMSQVDCRTGRLLRVNPAYCELLGRQEEELVGRPFSDFVHPDDREADAGGFHHMACGAIPVHDVEKRYVRPDGSIRRVHLVSSAIRDSSGAPLRSLAIVQDVTERREAEERQLLLAMEVDHRAKNALAVVQSALRLTPRDDAELYAKAVEGRVSALARAHTLLAEARWTGADLRTLAEGELEPFRGKPQVESETPQAVPRVEVSGPPFRLRPEAAQPVSIVLHELATNAAKHGALSVPGGAVDLSWAVDQQARVLRLTWSERGGPPVEAEPSRRGFGSRVIEATVRGQLGGEVSRQWGREGLTCTVEIALPKVTPSLPASQPG